MKSKTKIILFGSALVVAIIASFGIISSTEAAGTYCFPIGGCLGTSTPPTFGQVPLGNSGSTYSPTATSSLGMFFGTTGQNTIFTGLNTIAGTSTLFTTTSSRIGIGTTSPTSRLTVWGFGTGANSVFNIVNNASTTALTVTEASKVGIGTTNPFTALDVGGLFGAPSPFLVNTDPIATFSRSIDAVTGIAMRNTSGGTSADTYFSLFDGGGHSFGIRQPATTNTGSTILGQARATTDFLTSSNATGRAMAIGPQQAQPLIFATNNAEVMRITSAGNVGIGTTTPNAKFQVLTNDTTNKIYAYATTSAKDLEYADSKGNTYSGGDQVTVSSCGTGPSVVSGSNNKIGRIRAGSGITSSCTITFSDGGWTATANAPVCFAETEGSAVPLNASSTATALVITGGTFTSASIGYICGGF